MEIEGLRQGLPDSLGLKHLTRHETNLEPQFDSTLSQLERIQRMRKGNVVPPPLKVDVSSWKPFPLIMAGLRWVDYDIAS